MRRLSFLFIICLLLGQQSIAQSISGFVYDALTKESLLGVNIRSGSNGAVSEIDGSYSIDIDPLTEEIVFSYVGYKAQTISKSEIEGNVIEVYLEESNTFLEAAVVTGSRYERSISDSPVSISILKPNLIENTNTFAMDDVLDKMPGVQMIEGQVNIRGGSGWSYGAGSRVMLLVDDMPALQGDAGRPNWTDIPVENISQVEILKGASSSLYGSAALNGIINIRTGYAVAEPETKISTSYTYFMDPADINKKWWGKDNTIKAPQTFTSSLLHKRKMGKFDLVLNGYYLNEDTVYENGYNDRTRFSVNTRYRHSDRLTFGLNSMFNLNKRGDFFIWSNGGGGAYKPLAGAFSTGDSQRYYIDPSVTYFDKSNNRHKLLARYYFINNNNNINQSNSSKSYYGEYQFLKTWDKQNLSITSGIATHLVRSDSELFADTLTKSDNIAIYAQIEKKVFDDLNLTLGWRLENNKLVGPKEIDGLVYPENEFKESRSVFRAGLNYELADYTFLRASWGQGYRFPTITEKYVKTTFSSLFIFPNPELQSESGWSAELGLRQGFRLLGFEGFMDLAGFVSRYADMSEFTATEVQGVVGFQAQNVGDTDIKGVEFGVGGRSEFLSIPIELIAGVTYIDPKYVDFTDQLETSSSVDFNYLKYRTKYNWKFDLNIEPLNNLNVGFSVNRSSHMVAIDQLISSLGTIQQYRELNNNGFYKTDVRMSYEMGMWKFSLLGNNILNKEIVIRPGVLEATRNLAMRVDLSF